MRLYYRQWKGWGILALRLAGLFLLIMSVKVRREMATSKKHLREHALEIHTYTTSAQRLAALFKPPVLSLVSLLGQACLALNYPGKPRSELLE
jgi:hypothetical protein